MTIVAPVRARRLRRVAVVALLVLIAVAAMAAAMAVQHAGLPTGLERRMDAMQPGWIKRTALMALAWTAQTTGAIAQTASTPLSAPQPTVIGMNAPAVSFSASTVPFANLVMGSDWMDTHWQKLADQFQEGDGGIRSLPIDGTALRFLSIPPTTLEGFEARCTFTGSGTLTVAGAARTTGSGPNMLRFHAVNLRGKISAPWLVLTGVDPKHPLRDLDCRDVRLDRSVRFRPKFVDTLRGYGVIRFMDWQNANANGAVPWEQRHTPAGNRIDLDGVSIEDMLALARELDADPWFVMPWNAGDDYISRFAGMVRAQLPAGRHVYVEVGNEVWNTGFSVAKQAIKEGLERKLATDPLEAGMRRYAERTGQVMRLWEAAFAGRNGLVRVLSTQHVLPMTAQIALSFGDTARHVDALATAPYFGSILGGTGNTRESSLQQLAVDLRSTLEYAVNNRRVASGLGKRYIGYEGGQGLVLPAQMPLTEQLQHDPAMHDLYRQYLAGWRRDAGDVLCLLTSTAKPSPWGSWGLAAWEDETLEEAPKLRAVREVVDAQRAAPAGAH